MERLTKIGIELLFIGEEAKAPTNEGYHVGTIAKITADKVVFTDGFEAEKKDVIMFVNPHEIAGVKRAIEIMHNQEKRLSRGDSLREQCEDFAL